MTQIEWKNTQGIVKKENLRKLIIWDIVRWKTKVKKWKIKKETPREEREREKERHFFGGDVYCQFNGAWGTFKGKTYTKHIKYTIEHLNEWMNETFIPL